MRWISPALVVAAAITLLVGHARDAEGALWGVLALGVAATVVEATLLFLRRSTLLRATVIATLAIVLLSMAWQAWGFDGLGDFTVQVDVH